MGNTNEPQRRRVPAPDSPIRLYQDEFLWKIPIVGDIGSGKTSIMKKLVNNVFSINYKPTDKVEFFLRQIEINQNTLVRIQVWDVSGSERYGKRTGLYYQNALGAVVVLDVSKHASLKEASMWAADINSKITLGDNVKLPMILLANKMDLLPPEKKEKLAKKLDVLALRNGFTGWWMSSAKNNHNLERPFQVLVDKIISLNNKCPLILQRKIVPRDEEAEQRALTLLA